MKNKVKEIIHDFKNSGSAVIAFSGGVDSSLVAYIAKKALGKNVIAVTIDSKVFPQQELEEAKEIANEIKIKHKILKINRVQDPNFSKNNYERCYYCKKELCLTLQDFGSKKGYNLIVDGTNSSEIKGKKHRPGYKAIKEFDLYSPLAKYNIKKKDVRNMAENFGLSVKNKPSNSCLATRISHKEEITTDKLKKTEEAEKFLHDLGFEQLRVRKHGEIARIELPKEKKEISSSQMNKIHTKLKDIGFNHVTLDLNGYNSGSMKKT
ncbi:ATP-dependent sacrificial sulfur transferase LarE [archaeon SCG-AAA382B04]|nr:ATP-dependent sacrificial sulfur transferase LarE [archaeon SCG-AAA382B04]